MKKITLKIGKKTQTIKPKSMDDITRLTYIVQGEILKAETAPDLAGKFSCMMDDKIISPKELLLKLKDILKEGKDVFKKKDGKNKDKKKSSKKKKEVSVKNKKSSGSASKKKNKDKKKDDKKSSKKKKNKKCKKEKKSINFNKPESDDSGRIKLHRVK